MNKSFAVLEVYGDIVIDIEEQLKDLFIWTNYIMFVSANVAELKCSDHVSFLKAMKALESLVHEHTLLKSVTGVEDDWKILLLFGK